MAMFAALVITTALLSGCGSSASTKSQSIAKANAICRNVSSQTTPLIKHLTTAAESLLSSGGRRASQEVTSELQQLHTTANRTLEKLRALQPSASHSDIAQFLTPFATVTEALGRAAKVAAAGQAQTALLDVEAVASDSQRMTKAAKAEGLTACENALAAVP